MKRIIMFNLYYSSSLTQHTKMEMILQKLHTYDIADHQLDTQHIAPNSPIKISHDCQPAESNLEMTSEEPVEV